MKRTGEVQLLDDAVEELVETWTSGVACITGGPGSGKSTALAHLAAVFGDRDHVCFLDEPTASEVEARRRDALVLAATSRAIDAQVEFVLEPWRLDELIEYLLAAHPDDCRSVLARLGPAARRPWCPQLACIVLDEFAADYGLVDATDALVVHVERLLGDPRPQQAATEYCLSMLVGGAEAAETAGEQLAKGRCTAKVRALLRHRLVQLPLAAARVLGQIEEGRLRDLERPWPYELIEIVGWQCAANRGALDQLKKVLALERGAAAHPMAASVLLVADPAWRPERPRKPWRLAHGVFRRAQWRGSNFFGSDLRGCDFSSAELSGSEFETANLTRVNFCGARLHGANLLRTKATHACLSGADLSHTKLSGATLAGADLTDANLTGAVAFMTDFTGADLSNAVLQQADLFQATLIASRIDETDFTDANLAQAKFFGADLRTAHLNGACLEKANLAGAQLEDVQLVHARLRGASLRGAHLTGSVFPAGDLRETDLRSAGLAEIDWEESDLRGADLRGASFHMGSSRSGLVFSPYACEGSKTGFYTDDIEDLSFKRPEEIRKANLRGADLRGIRAAGVDFYLVDLRDAKLDAALREQARATGAILQEPSN